LWGEQQLSPITTLFAQTATTGNKLSDRANTKPKAMLAHKAEWVNPSRYDDEGRNVGDENVGVELDDGHA